jgi:hypothetical protein
MVKGYIATVQIVLPYDVTSEAEACDAVSGCLSENLLMSGAILDWSYLPMTEGAFGTTMGGPYLSPLRFNGPDTWEADQHDVSFYNPLLKNARRFLDCSTGHVSRATADLLDTECNGWPFIGGRISETGWFVYAHPEPPEGTPDDLKAVMAYARGNGFDYILFDRDADDVDGLPTFDW